MEERPLEGYPSHSHPTTQRIHGVNTWKMCECDAWTLFPLAELGHGEWGGGGNAKQCHLITDQPINCKLKTKIANTILLFCIDKMCLSPSCVLWHPSASLDSGAEPIKGSPSWQPASVDYRYTTFYSQHLCEEGSWPQQHTWNSKPLIFSR